MLTEPEAPYDRLLELVSDRTGVIHSLSRVRRGVEEPIPPYIYQTKLSHFDFRQAEESERIAAGKGCTVQEAILGAIGEAVEHYCASHFDTRRVHLARGSALGQNAVAPPDFVLYSAGQYSRRDFPYHSWSPTDEVTWFPARELPADRTMDVPASLVYLTAPTGRREDYFCPVTSNGLAAGPDVETALLNGCCELIERDGFLIHWMNRLPAPEVVFSADGGMPGSIRSHYQRFGVEVRLFNLTTDLPAYVMMAMALDSTGQGPAALVGLGCHLNPHVALLKAMLEICQVRPGQAQRYRKEKLQERLKRYEDVRTLEDHCAFLSVPERLGEFDFLLKNGRTQSIEALASRSQGSVTADLEMCVQGLSAGGHRVLYGELTTPDVGEYGLHVVRVLATGLQPMHFGYGEERLGGSRLFTCPQRLGLAQAPRTEADLNPCPHPLA